jgi:hypothetical protein
MAKGSSFAVREICPSTSSTDAVEVNTGAR